MELKIHDSQYVLMYLCSFNALEISQLVWCYYLDIHSHDKVSFSSKLQ